MYCIVYTLERDVKNTSTTVNSTKMKLSQIHNLHILTLSVNEEKTKKKHKNISLKLPLSLLF